MTFSEAVKAIKDMKIRRRTNCFINEHREEALDLAIRAIEEWDAIEAEIYEFAKYPNFGDLSTGASAGALRALEIINKHLEEVDE